MASTHSAFLEDHSKQFEYIKDIGSGNFGVTRLMRDLSTKELVAVKFLERGEKIDKNVEREILNHRDLKLENTLLDGSPAPLLKICDFGYSKSMLMDSQPKSTVGTPAYIAPEVLSKKKYDGHKADVWSCGVTLYVMLVGAYPFEDPQDPRNFRKTIQRIMSVSYQIPDRIRVSSECRSLLRAVFVADYTQRISITQIKQHPWYLKNLPDELRENYKNMKTYGESKQSIADVQSIIQKARTSPHVSRMYNRQDSLPIDDDEWPGSGGGYMLD